MRIFNVRETYQRPVTIVGRVFGNHVAASAVTPKSMLRLSGTT
jgi:hypothetical protein